MPQLGAPCSMLLVNRRKNIGCFDEYEVVQGSCVSYDRLHLQVELPVRLAIALNVFQCVFQFDAMALQPGGLFAT